jgi:signal transduction histidine kinase
VCWPEVGSTTTLGTLTKERLRRPPLRVQLTVLYAGLFLFLVAAVLGVSSLLVDHTSQAVPGERGAPPPSGDAGFASGHDFNFNVGPAIVGLLAVLLALWLAWLIAGRFLRPLRQMNATAQKISATNLHQRLGIDGPDDELSELGRTLDDLFARLEASFESQRHFVANASHELRTPLAGQRTLLQVALADPDATSAELRAACEEALQLGGQQERLIDALLTLATSERGLEVREESDLADLAEHVLVSRTEEARRRNLHIEPKLARAQVVGDPRLIESLVTNLVDNALRHNTRGGTIEVVTRSVGGRANLFVSNTGPVVRAQEMDRLFQPFQQVGAERVRTATGHGLGLAIVKAIAEAHGAKITARPRPQGGLDVEVAFVA